MATAKDERGYRRAEKEYAKQLRQSEIEMNIRVAIGFSRLSATDILHKLRETYPGKGYAWLKKHTERMIEKGSIYIDSENGHKKFRVRI